MKTLTMTGLRRAHATGSLLAFTAGSAAAADLAMWVRQSAADPGQLMTGLWNSGHANKIEPTAMPDTQLVTKLATSAQGGDAPDLVSFDLI